MTTTENKYDNHKNETQHNDNQQKTTSTTTTTTVHPEPGVSSHPLAPYVLERIKQAYIQNISSTIRASVASYIEHCLYAGMECEVIVEAIEETGWARNPSPYYMRAILDRYQRSGIMTVNQLKHDRFEREGERAEAVSERWENWYETK